jgi:hypothetical protein
MSRLLAGHSSGEQPHATRFSLAHSRVAHIYFPRTKSRASGAPQALERPARGAPFVILIPYLRRLSGLVLSFDETSGFILCSLLAGWTRGHVFARMKTMAPACFAGSKTRGVPSPLSRHQAQERSNWAISHPDICLNPWHRIDKRHHGIKGYCEQQSRLTWQYPSTTVGVSGCPALSNASRFSSGHRWHSCRVNQKRYIHRKSNASVRTWLPSLRASSPPLSCSNAGSMESA